MSGDHPRDRSESSNVFEKTTGIPNPQTTFGHEPDLRTFQPDLPKSDLGRGGDGQGLLYTFDDHPEIPIQRPQVARAPLLYTFEGEGLEDLTTEPVDHVRVAMVEAERGLAGNNGALPQIVKETNMPKFSGEACDFDIFAWVFARFLDNLEEARGSKLSENEKLILLERALPNKERKRLLLMQRYGTGVTCQGFLRDLQGVLSVTQESQIRQRWNELSMRYGGRITLPDLYNFQLEFEQLRYHLSHLTEGECHRHLMAKLPGQLVNYVHDEETRLHVSRPQVLIELPGDHAASAVKDTMERLLKISAKKSCPRKAKTIFVYPGRLV